LEPEKAEIIIMAVAHLHNFLRKSMHSVNMYTPPGTFDTETNGELTQGSWLDGKLKCKYISFSKKCTAEININCARNSRRDCRLLHE